MRKQKIETPEVRPTYVSPKEKAALKAAKRPKKEVVFKTGKTWKGKNALSGEPVAPAEANLGVRCELRADDTYEVFNAAGKVIAKFNAPKAFKHK